MKYAVSAMGCGIMIVLLSGCNNGMGSGMSMEDLITEEGLSNPFAFRDFRLGMTRSEVYQVLNGVKLSPPDEPKDSSYQEWGSEITVPSYTDDTKVWSGLPNNPYAAVNAFSMEFDDGRGIVTGDEQENRHVTLHPNMLTSEERRARLRTIYFFFHSEKRMSTSIVEACERRFAGLQVTQTEMMGALGFFWLNQSSLPRGQQQIAVLFVREGESSGFLGVLMLTDVEYFRRKLK